MSTKNNHVEIKTWLMEDKRRTKLIRIQNPGGHKEGRASFPIQSQYQVSIIHTSTSTPREVKRRTEGEEHRGGGLGDRTIHGHNTKAAINLTQVNGYLYPRDLSDRYVGPVGPVD